MMAALHTAQRCRHVGHAVMPPETGKALTNGIKSPVQLIEISHTQHTVREQPRVWWTENLDYGKTLRLAAINCQSPSSFLLDVI